ncbi:MAG: glycoside hydrolase family 113, partial [Planctomycetota bacterium]
MRVLIGCILLAAALIPAGAGATEAPTGDTHRVVRGMTVSCQTWGWEWGTEEMVREMRELKALGVNWIAIHPYAGIRGDGSVAMHRRWYGDTKWLTRPIAEAHRLGLKIMIKPHLAYWGSPFRWRGDITFETDEQWQRFFGQYEAWVTRAAEICAEA